MLRLDDRAILAASTRRHFERRFEIDKMLICRLSDTLISANEYPAVFSMYSYRRHNYFRPASRPANFKKRDEAVCFHVTVFVIRRYFDALLTALYSKNFTTLARHSAGK